MKEFDITSCRFGKLTAIKSLGRKKGKHLYWLCKCDCGKFIEVRKDSLTRGLTHSCGCLIGEVAKQLYTKHNLYQSRLYKIYQGMKMRCYNPKNPRYNVYGARGIKVCEEWLTDFLNFYNWALKNGYNDNLSIDRINVNGNYEPTNCRWATDKEQAINTRRNHIIEYKGQQKTISEWAGIYNLAPSVLGARIRLNWDIEKALNTPVKQYNLKHC